MSLERKKSISFLSFNKQELRFQRVSDLSVSICFLNSDRENLMARGQVARVTYIELVINNTFFPFSTCKHQNYTAMGNFAIYVSGKVLCHSTLCDRLHPHFGSFIK